MLHRRAPGARGPAPPDPFPPPGDSMPSYVPPLRDMRFVLHEVLDVVGALKQLPAHAEIDAGTIDAVIEEAGKFASEVVAPLNPVGDAEGCKLDQATHEVKTGTGF